MQLPRVNTTVVMGLIGFATLVFKSEWDYQSQKSISHIENKEGRAKISDKIDALTLMVQKHITEDSIKNIKQTSNAKQYHSTKSQGATE